MEIYQTKTVRIFLREDGILQKDFLENTNETLDTALECEVFIKKLSNGELRPMIVDFTCLRSIDAAALAYYASNRPIALICACAAVTRTKVGKVIVNFFIKFNRAPTPVRLFNSQEEAIEWLKKFV